MPATPFTAAELVAIAGAVKPAQLKAARDQIADNSVHPVDLKIRLRGSVNRLEGTPAAKTKIEVTSTPNLCSPLIVTELFRRLGTKPARVAELLRELAVSPTPLPPDPKREELAKLFDAIAAEHETTRRETRTTNAISGAIYTTIEISRR